MTLADLLSDLRYVAAHDQMRPSHLDDFGDMLVDLGMALAIRGRLRVTDAGFAILEACADVVLEGS